MMNEITQNQNKEISSESENSKVTKPMKKEKNPNRAAAGKRLKASYQCK